MNNQLRDSIKTLADGLEMSDLELTDHYNTTFGSRVACPPYRHITDEQASKLLLELAKETDRREEARSKRRSH